MSSKSDTTTTNTSYSANKQSQKDGVHFHPHLTRAQFDKILNKRLRAVDTCHEINCKGEKLFLESALTKMARTYTQMYSLFESQRREMTALCTEYNRICDEYALTGKVKMPAQADIRKLGNVARMVEGYFAKKKGKKEDGDDEIMVILKQENGQVIEQQHSMVKPEPVQKAGLAGPSTPPRNGRHHPYPTTPPKLEGRKRKSTEPVPPPLVQPTPPTQQRRVGPSKEGQQQPMVVQQNGGFQTPRRQQPVRGTRTPSTTVAHTFNSASVVGWNGSSKTPVGPTASVLVYPGQELSLDSGTFQKSPTKRNQQQNGGQQAAMAHAHNGHVEQPEIIQIDD